MNKELKQMTKKELKDEYVSVCETIDVIGCFGTRDLRWRDALEIEINKRGMEIIQRVEVI